jgi:hypothetical protein
MTLNVNIECVKSIYCNVYIMLVSDYIAFIFMCISLPYSWELVNQSWWDTDHVPSSVIGDPWPKAATTALQVRLQLRMPRRGSALRLRPGVGRMLG